MACAVIIELLGKVPGRPVRYTVANAAALEKGCLVQMETPRTIIATAADNDPFAGIAAAEKVTLDGQTSIACYTHGIFDITNDAAATILIGERVSIKGANDIAKVAAADRLFSNVGIALEAGAINEVIAVLVGSGF